MHFYGVIDITFLIEKKKSFHKFYTQENNRAMNYLMYHQSGEGQFPKVPDGLKELMSDISREVLREQPENIYEFIAEYLEAMELTREHKGSNEK